MLRGPRARGFATGRDESGEATPRPVTSSSVPSRCGPGRPSVAVAALYASPASSPSVRSACASFGHSAAPLSPKNRCTTTRLRVPSWLRSDTLPGPFATSRHFECPVASAATLLPDLHVCLRRFSVFRRWCAQVSFPYSATRGNTQLDAVCDVAMVFTMNHFCCSRTLFRLLPRANPH